MSKKIGLVSFILLLIGLAAWLIYSSKNKSSIVNLVSEYGDVVKQSASAPTALKPESAPDISLTAMLRAGIYTDQGILQSESINLGNIAGRRLMLNGQPLQVQAVSEIELVKAFELGNQQIVLFGFNQGGNQCGIQYQMLSITESTSSTSKVFGSCLQLTSVVESGNEIILSLPQNNPYLGADVLVNYKYSNGQIYEQAKLTKQQLKQKYANLNASKILQVASADGCYVDGIMLDDNSCGNGRKYCVMFKNLTHPVKNADYKLLKSFCTN